MGNYIQSIKQGADTVIITGSCGPCRFGEYCELQINILKKLGYNVNFIVLDKPADIGLNELLKRIGNITSGSNINKLKKARALYIALKIMKLIEKIEAKAHYLAGYEINRGDCKRLLNKCKIDTVKCNKPEKRPIYPAA
jgi:predicted nucleotide-binding protein (sugar kinase/HSP70/actin superfamily)